MHSPGSCALRQSDGVASLRPKLARCRAASAASTATRHSLHPSHREPPRTWSSPRSEGVFPRGPYHTQLGKASGRVAAAAASEAPSASQAGPRPQVPPADVGQSRKQQDCETAAAKGRSLRHLLEGPHVAEAQTPPSQSKSCSGRAAGGGLRGSQAGDRSQATNRDGGGDDDGGGGRDTYVLNYGNAVRVLREDLPQLLARPLQWGIYRQDLCLVTPWAAPLKGLSRYQLVHRVMRLVARLLFHTATVEVMRIWTPMTGPGGIPSGGGSGGWGNGGTGTGTTIRRRGGHSASDSDSERGPGGGADGGGDGGDGGDGGRERPQGGQLRVRWRATGHPWMPWSEEQRLEVVATYRLDHRGLIAVHELTTVIPPEPPLLLWPLLVVAQLLGRVKGRQGAATRGGMPIPGAGAGMGAGPEVSGGSGSRGGV